MSQLVQLADLIANHEDSRLYYHVPQTELPAQ